MTRIGLVLGAGGIVGQAYHAGVLAALEHDLGWDPRTADVIVGTSAGSITGTLLRLGVPAEDLARFAVEAPLSIDGAPILDELATDLPEFPPPRIADYMRGWRLPPAALLARTARSPWRFRPSVAAMTLLPPGKFDLSAHTGRLDGLARRTWPDALWLCAARRDDGARVVFGRPGAPAARVAEAVAASCAIPGYFRPVEIDGVEYFDGGVHSPTNADVLSRADLDLVIALSPMSAARGRARTPDAVLRWSFHRRLLRELDHLRAGGTDVVFFEPGPEVLRVMGTNAMAQDRSAAVVQEAFIETGTVAGRDTCAARLAPIARRPRLSA